MEQERNVDPDTGLDILVPGMSQHRPLVETTPEETRKRLETSREKRPQQPQPLATRHLDPNYNPALGIDVAGIGPKVPKDRCKLRAGYMYYYGEREAFRGPAILYLTAEERKGQEHKLEVLGDEPVQMAAASKPVAVSEDMTARDRAEKIQVLRLELDALTAEHEAYLKNLDKRKTDTVQDAPENPDAKSQALTAEPPEGPGDVTGPKFNPDAEEKPAKPKRGRPPGKVNRIK